MDREIEVLENKISNCCSANVSECGRCMDCKEVCEPVSEDE